MSKDLDVSKGYACTLIITGPDVITNDISLER